MYNPPNYLIQKLIKDLAEVRKTIEEINEKIEDPNLFEEIAEKAQKTKKIPNL